MYLFIYLFNLCTEMSTGLYALLELHIKALQIIINRFCLVQYLDVV